MSRLQIILAALLTIALLAAYVGLTIAGHDGTVLLGALLGQLGQSGLTAAGSKKA